MYIHIYIYMSYNQYVLHSLMDMGSLLRTRDYTQLQEGVLE